MTEFLNMGGYGAYVWSAYGIVALSLAYLAFKAHWQVQNIKRQLSELEK